MTSYNFTEAEYEAMRFKADLNEQVAKLKRIFKDYSKVTAALEKHGHKLSDEDAAFIAELCLKGANRASAMAAKLRRSGP